MACRASTASQVDQGSYHCACACTGPWRSGTSCLSGLSAFEVLGAASFNISHQSSSFRLRRRTFFKSFFRIWLVSAVFGVTGSGQNWDSDMAQIQPSIAKDVHRAVVADAQLASDLSVSCEDFGAFQEALQGLRRIDDRIIYLLNTTIPTLSFSSGVNPSQECRGLYEQLQIAYRSRERVIRKCVDESAGRVSSLKEQRDQNSGDQSDLMRRLRKEQSKLRLLQSELNVEEVIKDRTYKVFHDRCKLHYQTPPAQK